MKKIALIFLLLSNILFSQSLVKTYYDPLYKTKLKEVYQVKENTPIANGYYKAYDEYGNILELRNYTNNKLNGKLTKYIGTYEATATYGGKKSIGKIKQISNYKNDKLDGQELRYNFSENGKRYLQFKKLYKKGILIKHIEFFENNKIKKNLQIGKCYEYYEDGKKFAEYNSDENGQLQGKYLGWYNSGELEIKGNFLDDEKNGEWYEYFKNGKIKKKELYKLGKKILSEKETEILDERKLKEEKQKEIVRIQNERMKIEKENERLKKEKLANDKKKKENERIILIEKVENNLNDLKIEKNNLEIDFKILDEFKSSITGKKVYKYKKKNLYNAYKIALKNLQEKFNNSNNITEKNKTLELILKLVRKVNSLKEAETKKLEKQLKKMKDPQKIIEILKL